MCVCACVLVPNGSFTLRSECLQTEGLCFSAFKDFHLRCVPNFDEKEEEHERLTGKRKGVLVRLALSVKERSDLCARCRALVKNETEERDRKNMCLLRPVWKMNG